MIWGTQLFMWAYATFRIRLAVMTVVLVAAMFTPSASAQTDGAVARGIIDPSQHLMPTFAADPNFWGYRFNFEVDEVAVASDSLEVDLVAKFGG